MANQKRNSGFLKSTKADIIFFFCTCGLVEAKINELKGVCPNCGVKIDNNVIKELQMAQSQTATAKPEPSFIELCVLDDLIVYDNNIKFSLN